MSSTFPDSLLSQEALDRLFLEARTYNAWQDKPVPEALLHQLWDLTRMPPTSANCSPMRVLFLSSTEAKEKLRPHLAAGNVDKTMSAPVTAILANDEEFHEKLPQLFPHTDARSWFAGEGNRENRLATAFRNGTLQAGYFIMAARGLGLDCGPMSGFDNAGLDEAFFGGTTVKSNFLCNLGYGDPENLFPRSPRFAFEEACQIL